MSEAELIQQTVRVTLEMMGYKPRSTQQWMSQNQASKLIGRRTLEKAMQRGEVKWKKEDLSNPRCPVKVSRKDVLTILNQ